MFRFFQIVPSSLTSMMPISIRVNAAVIASIHVFQMRSDKGVVIGCGDGVQRLRQYVADNASEVLGHESSHKRVLGAAGYYGPERLVQAGCARSLTRAFAVAGLHQRRGS